MIALVQPAKKINEFVDVYYYPNGTDYPTDKRFPVPTFIRSWLIFCIDGNVNILIDGHEFTPPKVSVKSPFKHPYLFGYTQSKISAVIVQFSAVGLYELANTDVSKINNRYTDAYELWDGALLDNVSNMLAVNKTKEERIAVVNDFFIQLTKLRCSDALDDKSILVNNAIQYAQSGKYTMPMTDVCGHLAVSSKTLERAFKTVTGITPKKYFSACLFEELTRELITEKSKRVSEIMNSPFYDFSHINKWFTGYANLAPSVFNKQEYHLLEEIMKHQNQFRS